MPSVSLSKPVQQSLEKIVEVEGRLATKAFDAIDQNPQLKGAITSAGEKVVNVGGRAVDEFIDNMTPETRKTIMDGAEAVMRFEWKVLSTLFKGAASLFGVLDSNSKK